MEKLTVSSSPPSSGPETCFYKFPIKVTQEPPPFSSCKLSPLVVSIRVISSVTQQLLSRLRNFRRVATRKIRHRSFSSCISFIVIYQVSNKIRRTFHLPRHKNYFLRNAIVVVISLGKRLIGRSL